MTSVGQVAPVSMTMSNPTEGVPPVSRPSAPFIHSIIVDEWEPTNPAGPFSIGRWQVAHPHLSSSFSHHRGCESTKLNR
jgi:hypothetical protein